MLIWLKDNYQHIFNDSFIHIYKKKIKDYQLVYTICFLLATFKTPPGLICEAG